MPKRSNLNHLSWKNCLAQDDVLKEEDQSCSCCTLHRNRNFSDANS
jgi:hypothetical protein